MKEGTASMMRKGWICLLICLAAVLILGITAGSRAEGTGLVQGELYAYIVKWDGSASVIGYRGEDTAVIIPEEMDGYPVTEIAGVMNISSEMARELSDYCSGWYNLTDVTIPGTVTCIRDNAFIQCRNLEHVTIPEGVVSIGKNAFAANSMMTGVTIPASVSRIGSYAFCGDKLTEITVADDNPVYESIDGVLFDKTTGTLVQYPLGRTSETYEIPAGTICIGMGAFAGSTESPAFLKQVIIPDTVTRIGNGAFSGQHALQNIEIPDSVTRIDIGAFSRCSGLESVKLPKELKVIRTSVFNFCSNLKQITIPESVTLIESRAFSDTGLTSVTIPGGAQIGEYAFSGNIALKQVILEEGITEIQSGAFSNCLELTDIRFPDTLRLIESDAFAYCERLVSVTLPDSVIAIGNRAFRNCTALGKVEWVHVTENEAEKADEPYFSYRERNIMARLLESLDAWQQGERIIRAGGMYDPEDKDSYRQIIVDELQNQIDEAQTTIADTEAKIIAGNDNRKATALERMIQNKKKTIEALEAEMEYWKTVPMITPYEAELRLKEKTGLDRTPGNTRALCNAFLEIWDPLSNDENVPEGYPNGYAFMSIDTGLGMGASELNVMDRIAAALHGESDRLSYESGIAENAFEGCEKLK